MAFYPVGDAQRAGVPYHSALLLLPKNPNLRKQEGVKYHYRNEFRGGKDVWYFERVPNVPNRENNLLSLALLGKIEGQISEADIRRILERVEVPAGSRCRNWAWKGVEVCSLRAL